MHRRRNRGHAPRREDHEEGRRQGVGGRRRGAGGPGRGVAPAAGRPVRGSTTVLALRLSVPEPLRSPVLEQDPARAGRVPVFVAPVPTGQPSPRLPFSRSRSRSGGQGRARAGVEEDVRGLPVLRARQGRRRGRSPCRGRRGQRSSAGSFDRPRAGSRVTAEARPRSARPG
ncbi:MAG: hypothetical protein MZV64_67965 [Ignavibacteriales bacterium]|nr:hypothetical protein [Ignavibacteriales bacterium]